MHLVCGPVYHTAPGSQGQMHLGIGATLVILPRFDAEACLAAIERHRVTNAMMVPAMFFRILALPEAARRRYDLSSLRKVLHAAAPCPIDVKRKMIEWWGPVLHEYYAGTEGNGMDRVEGSSRGRVGSALAGPRRQGPRRRRTRGVFGESARSIWDHPGARFSYRGPAKTRAAFAGDYFTVGDMGYLDAEGYPSSPIGSTT